MNKNSTKIVNGIGGLIMIVGAILGIVYVLTGKVLYGKFIGHVDSHLRPESDFPEILDLIGFFLFMIGLSVSCTSLLIEQKGFSRIERKEAIKPFSLYFTGGSIGVVSAIFLMCLLPGSANDYKSVSWYYFALCINITSIIVIILGFVKGLRLSKAPLINNSEIKTTSKNETSTDEF